MPLTRRSLAAAAAMLPLTLSGRAYAADPRETIRAAGDPKAKVTVMEFFSLTCPHCAAFAKETFPRIEAELIKPGKVYYVFGDYPLDQLALNAAMLARALPAERYEPFVNSLFASQYHWAFNRDVNVTEELFKRAALAGMDRTTFDATLADQGFRNWMIQQQAANEAKYAIDSTPTFIVNGHKSAGEMSFDSFDKLVASAG
jgi:protein-disulfide isomerase